MTRAKHALARPRSFRIVEHYRPGSWAVEFIDGQGRRYRTLFTTYRSEAETWTDAVKAYGWCVSGRPYLAATPFEREDYVIAARRAA